jgi:hypothetical protein
METNKQILNLHLMKNFRHQHQRPKKNTLVMGREI